METKKYGLIHLSKQSKALNTTLKKNIFESDSDSDDSQTDSNAKRVNTSTGIRRQTQIDISRALTDDPNVYEYDAIYDEMKSKKESIDTNDSEEKEPKDRNQNKPKYINSLLKFSENRKKENERRIERKIQKEREMEGNMFEDKDQFVTNAYKEKLKELREADERERREEQVEELLDVKKQKDLSGFYRHLLNNDMNSQPIDSTPEPIEKPKEIQKTASKPKTSRQFRKRRSSSEESSEETTIKEQIMKKSDERIETKLDSNKQNSVKEVESSESEDNQSINENDLQSKQTNEKIETNVEKENTTKEETIKKPKLDKRELLLKIFTKRTVGEVYSAAQMRYFERKDKYIL